MKTSLTERENPAEDFPIQSVAAWLRAAREARGETLDEVVKITRIGKNYLEALEEGDLSKLPSQAYTRGFIRLYAAHLGLSPETALTMLDAGHRDPVAETAQIRPEHAGKHLPVYRRSFILIAVLASALTITYVLVTRTSPGNTPTQNSRIDTPPPQQTIIPATTPPAGGPPQSNTPSQPPPPPETADSQGVVLRLKAVSNGKITITIDGSFSQEYDLVSGDLVEWKAEDAIRLDLNNAASVEGELDGVKMAPFGPPGSAAHLVVKADGIHKE